MRGSTPWVLEAIRDGGRTLRVPYLSPRDTDITRAPTKVTVNQTGSTVRVKVIQDVTSKDGRRPSPRRLAFEVVTLKEPLGYRMLLRGAVDDAFADWYPERAGISPPQGKMTWPPLAKDAGNDPVHVRGSTSWIHEKTRKGGRALDLAYATYSGDGITRQPARTEIQETPTVVTIKVIQDLVIEGTDFPYTAPPEAVTALLQQPLGKRKLRHAPDQPRLC